MMLLTVHEIALLHPIFLLPLSVRLLSRTCALKAQPRERALIVSVHKSSTSDGAQ